MEIMCEKFHKTGYETKEEAIKVRDETKKFFANPKAVRYAFCMECRYYHVWDRRPSQKSRERKRNLRAQRMFAAKGG